MSYQEVTIAKWREWIEKINSDLRKQQKYNYVFFEVGKIVEEGNVNPHGNIFIEMLKDSFLDSFTMTIRRQIKNDDDSISLVRLLTQMSKEPNINLWFPYTDDPRPGLSPSRPLQVKHHDFSKVTEEIDQLKALAKKFEDYGDKRIAHYDRRDSEFNGIWDETNKLLEALVKIKDKYNIILTGANIPRWTPPVRDWKRIFQKAWIPESAEVREADDVE